MPFSIEDKWCVGWDGVSLPEMGIGYTEKRSGERTSACIYLPGGNQVREGTHFLASLVIPMHDFTYEELMQLCTEVRKCCSS